MFFQNAPKRQKQAFFEVVPVDMMVVDTTLSFQWAKPVMRIHFLCDKINLIFLVNVICLLTSWFFIKSKKLIASRLEGM
jgi:hypothetical protein